jgi:hypothetical protein
MLDCDWSSDVCSSDLSEILVERVKFLRNAEANGQFAQALGGLNAL